MKSLDFIVSCRLKNETDLVPVSNSKKKKKGGAMESGEPLSMAASVSSTVLLSKLS